MAPSFPSTSTPPPRTPVPKHHLARLLPQAGARPAAGDLALRRPRQGPASSHSSPSLSFSLTSHLSLSVCSNRSRSFSSSERPRPPPRPSPSPASPPAAPPCPHAYGEAPPPPSIHPTSTARPIPLSPQATGAPVALQPLLQRASYPEFHSCSSHGALVPEHVDPAASNSRAEAPPRAPPSSSKRSTCCWRPRPPSTTARTGLLPLLSFPVFLPHLTSLPLCLLEQEQELLQQRAPEASSSTLPVACISSGSAAVPARLWRSSGGVSTSPESFSCTLPPPPSSNLAAGTSILDALTTISGEPRRSSSLTLYLSPVSLCSLNLLLFPSTGASMAVPTSSLPRSFSLRPPRDLAIPRSGRGPAPRNSSRPRRQVHRRLNLPASPSPVPWPLLRLHRASEGSARVDRASRPSAPLRGLPWSLHRSGLGPCSGYVAIVRIRLTTLVRLPHGLVLLPSGISIAGTGFAMIMTRERCYLFWSSSSASSSIRG
ncbi:uncharacterized protein [Aegilops tauschii subsp. strangulata]|uniref:uncharacterized protein n=1 Tax=Aegilops tauschii subsp. strangulata TaxID=200361 RepID=UPI003CC84E41